MPTFIVVPGAWHSATHYDALIRQLRSAGHPVLMISLPGLNAIEPSTATCRADAEAIRRQLLPLIEKEGKDLVVVSHSYGGIPGGGAAHALSKCARTKNGKAAWRCNWPYVSVGLHSP